MDTDIGMRWCMRRIDGWSIAGWVLLAVDAVLFIALIALVMVTAAYAGECPARQLKPGEALDHECRLFRVVKVNGERWIELPEGNPRRTEKIDCSKAVVEEGVRIYHARSVAADFYCGGVK